MSTTKYVVKFTVLGEPASKANSRRIVTMGTHPAVIKSKKALGYEKTFARQCPEIRPLVECDLRVTMTIYYASRRPDLDESVILDCMQAKKTKLPNGEFIYLGGVYKNDRQVKEKHIYWALDRNNPRTEILVEKL